MPPRLSASPRAAGGKRREGKRHRIIQVGKGLKIIKSSHQPNPTTPAPEPRSAGDGDTAINTAGMQEGGKKMTWPARKRQQGTLGTVWAAVGEAPVMFLKSLVLRASLGTSSCSTLPRNSYFRSIYRDIKQWLETHFTSSGFSPNTRAQRCAGATSTSPAHLQHRRPTQNSGNCFLQMQPHCKIMAFFSRTEDFAIQTRAAPGPGSARGLWRAAPLSWRGPACLA